ncbi:MAG: hypothetical protein ACTSWZ_00740 [Candidatus Heimdallarchaeaceae archaeon]
MKFSNLNELLAFVRVQRVVEFLLSRFGLSGLNSVVQLFLIENKHLIVEIDELLKKVYGGDEVGNQDK